MATPPAVEELPDDLRAHAQRLAAATGMSLDDLLASTIHPTPTTEAIAAGWSENLEGGAAR